MKCTNEKWKLTKILSFRFEEQSQRRGLRNDGDGNENVKTVIGLLSKTTSLHTHPLRFFGTFLCRYFTITTWKCLISRFMEDVNKRRRNFLSLSKLECGSQEINSRGGNLFTAKWNKRDRVWKTLIYLKSDVFGASFEVAVVLFINGRCHFYDTSVIESFYEKKKETRNPWPNQTPNPDPLVS